MSFSVLIPDVLVHIIMATSTLKDAVKKLLQADRIALWTAPYTNEDGSLGQIPDTLVERYMEVCGASRKEIIETLNAFREHAYTKFLARKTGGLQMEVVGDVVVSVRGHSQPAADITVRTSLLCPVSYLRQMISEQGIILPSAFKLIACGKVLEDSKSLRDEGVTFGSHSVVAVVLSPDQQRQEQQWRSRQEVLRVREAAQTLAARKDGGSGQHAQRYSRFVTKTESH